MGTSYSERMLYVLWRWKGRRGGGVFDKEFATAAQISQSYLTQLKKADAPIPPAETVLKIAREGEVDPGWLTFGSDSGSPSPEGFAEWIASYREHERRAAAGRAAAAKVPKLPPRKTAAQLKAEANQSRRKRA